MGLLEKMKSGLAKTRKQMTASINTMIADLTEENEEVFDELEEMLILSDAGIETTERIIYRFRWDVREKGCRGEEQLRSTLTDVLTEAVTVGDAELQLDSKPAVILVVGVNGVGKTTTIGKLAARLTAEGKKVLLCAGDTFRAAAAEQLTVWAERAGCDIVRHEEGSDPAAVVFDSIAAARARSTDVIIVDTAGRLHNKQNLMNELSKIRRVIDRELPESCVECLMVLDATTGQNGLIQAKQFMESANLTGIVLTKLDGTAKGGIVFAITDQLKLPVKFVGVGEGIDDLMPFDPRAFSEALLS
ncbi:MAG: signal recognition particle-docking protein FtsY [Oscillospiraceae bacterium]|nr:signal recognition particle-docking protein FtsY [Oscillospiraceae bacterium]